MVAPLEAQLRKRAAVRVASPRGSQIRCLVGPVPTSFQTALIRPQPHPFHSAQKIESQR